MSMVRGEAAIAEAQQALAALWSLLAARAAQPVESAARYLLQVALGRPATLPVAQLLSRLARARAALMVEPYPSPQGQVEPRVHQA